MVLLRVRHEKKQLRIGKRQEDFSCGTVSSGIVSNYIGTTMGGAHQPKLRNTSRQMRKGLSSPAACWDTRDQRLKSYQKTATSRVRKIDMIRQSQKIFQNGLQQNQRWIDKCSHDGVHSFSPKKYLRSLFSSDGSYSIVFLKPHQTVKFHRKSEGNGLLIFNDRTKWKSWKCSFSRNARSCRSDATS